MILKLWPKKQAKKNLHNSGLVIGAPLRPLESLDYQKEKKEKKRKKKGSEPGHQIRELASQNHINRNPYIFWFLILFAIKKKKKNRFSFFQ